MPKSDGPEPSRSGKAEDGHALYLYCLARPQVTRSLHGPGVDGVHPVQTHTFRDLAAIVSQVPVADFCGPAAEAHLQDLAWLAPRACHHEAVAEQALRLSPVVPARFGTLFSSSATLARFLGKHYATIDRLLKRMAHKEEWVVKGLLDRNKARENILSRMLAGQEAARASLSPGMRYLYEQGMKAEVEKELNAWLKRSCDDLIKSFGCRAADVCRRRVLPAAAAEKDLAAVLNCAFLVPRSAVARLRTGIRGANARYADRGLIFTLTGPWPPFSFCPSLEVLAPA